MKHHFLFLFVACCCKIAHANDASALIAKNEASSQKVSREAGPLIESLANEAKRESTVASNMINSFYDSSSSGKPSQHIFLNSEKIALNEEEPRLFNEGKGACVPQHASLHGKCQSSLLKNPEQAHLEQARLGHAHVKANFERRRSPSNPSSPTQLLIFVSQSMPAGSINTLWEQARKIGAKLLFRGLIGASFKETQNYIKELGIVADIDPTKFDEYQVTQVPTFVLFLTDASGTGSPGTNAFETDASAKNTFDKVSGHISLLEVLDQFRKKGDLKEEANRLYIKLKEDRS